MKLLKHALAAAIVATVPFVAQAQVAGGTVLGVTETVSARLANGWSVKKAILGENVYNDANKSEEVGKVDDIIIDTEGYVSYAIVNASKYLGLSSHLVAVPVEQFKVENGHIVLPGVTKEGLRNVPKFEYAKTNK